MTNNVRDFKTDLDWSLKMSRSATIRRTYGKVCGSKVKKRAEEKEFEVQKRGYDVILTLEDGRKLTVEEKFLSYYRPTVVAEYVKIPEARGKSPEIGWLYKSEAEILAYFQKLKRGWDLTMWKLKDLAKWTRTEAFEKLVEQKKVWFTEQFSKIERPHQPTVKWSTVSYIIPVTFLRDQKLEYIDPEYEKIRNMLPIYRYINEHDDDNECQCDCQRKLDVV